MKIWYASGNLSTLRTVFDCRTRRLSVERVHSVSEKLTLLSSLTGTPNVTNRREGGKKERNFYIFFKLSRTCQLRCILFTYLLH